MSRFGSDPRSFFDAVYTDTPPWDIGGPQPAMSALLTEYPPLPSVLDVGCGSGDLSIHLAGLGYQTVGVDFVEAAIAHAQQKRTALPPGVADRVEFRVADALRPSLLQQQFGSVVDSGFYHLFDPDQCNQYADELAQTLIPGGRLYLHAFNVDFSSMPNLPRQITAEELQTRFTVERGWRILEIRPVEFLSRVAPPVAATAACIERLPGN